MTSDGITDAEWADVVALSANIANAVIANHDGLAKILTKKLLKRLDGLQKKYGALPSILATKAECVASIEEHIKLLEQAWSAANEASDSKNLVLISSSLAQLYIDELHECTNGWKWLKLLETSLENYSDDEEYKELQRLRVLCGNCDR